MSLRSILNSMGVMTEQEIQSFVDRVTNSPEEALKAYKHHQEHLAKLRKDLQGRRQAPANYRSVERLANLAECEEQLLVAIKPYLPKEVLVYSSVEDYFKAEHPDLVELLANDHSAFWQIVRMNTLTDRQILAEIELASSPDSACFQAARAIQSARIAGKLPGAPTIQQVANMLIDRARQDGKRATTYYDNVLLAAEPSMTEGEVISYYNGFNDGFERGRPKTR